MSSDRTGPVDDQQLIDAIAVANIPTLLMVLVQMTGDTRWLEAPYTPRRQTGMGETCDMFPDKHFPRAPGASTWVVCDITNFYWTVVVSDNGDAGNAGRCERHQR